MASDLRRCGYKRTDVLRIYGLNLILLPVNLAGVCKSIQQAVTGKKIPFARTPKVSNRTATPLLFALSPLLLIGYSVWTVIRSYHSRHWGDAAFAGLNAVAASYAVLAFIGLRNCLVDIILGSVEKLFVTERETPVVEVRPRRELATATPSTSWRDVLFLGAAGTDSGRHGKADPAYRILADAPVPAAERNRRSTDRDRGPMPQATSAPVSAGRLTSIGKELP